MSVTVSISAVQTHTPDVDADTIRTVTVHRRWYRSLWASTTLAIESPTNLFVAFYWLERSSCRFPVTWLVFSRADHSTSQVLTTFYAVFISTFYWRLASKAAKLIRPPADWSTAVTSHAAINSDARSIQISSQNIRIRRQASMQAAAVQMCNKAKLSEPSSINGLHIHMGLG